MKNKYLLIRILIIGLAVAAVLFLLERDLAWTGKVKFQTDFLKFKPLVSILTPQERVKMVNNANNVYIEQEPVYFDLYFPRDFDKAKLEFEYQNFFPIIEIGSKVGETGTNLKSFNNDVLNSLAWPRLEENGLILWQREPKYQSISDFEANLPEIKEVATYFYNDLYYNRKLKDYQALNKLNEYNYNLKGTYSFLTYIKDEQMYFEFLMDIGNWELADEAVTATVADLQGNVVETFLFQPENNKVVVALDNLPEGVYQIIFSPLGEDIVTKKIKTKQSKLAFVNEIYLGAAKNVFTDVADFKFTAQKNEGLQKIKINNEEMEIKEIYQPYNISAKSGFNRISLAKGFVSVSGRGLFSLYEEQFFDPFPQAVSSGIDFDQAGINYIIAAYHLPRIKDGFKINSVEFDLTKEDIKNGKIRFVISVPGLTSSSDGVLIKNLKVTLERKPVWEDGLIANIKNYLKYYLHEIE